ncbi:MAG: hypothetical protein WA876_03235 [Candidatus Acidiferrales bacterium]
MIKIIVGWLTPIGGLVAAFWAVWTYHKSAKLGRARWMKELYEKFYEQQQLKSVRRQLDSGDAQHIAKLVKDEDESFTDYLNFFEFLAYLEESGQVKTEDMLGIFGYYLQNLKSSPAVVAYVKDPAKGYEKLRRIVEGDLQ